MPRGKSRLRGFLPLLPLALFAIALLLPSATGLENARARVSRRAAKLARHAATKSGLIHLWTFDDPTASDFATGLPSLCPGTTLTQGKFGHARKFNCEDRTHIDTRANWRELGESFTMSAWIRLDRRRDSQDIWCASIQKRPIGLRLEMGILCFDVTSGDYSVSTLSHKFTRYGEFVHVAATVDAASGLAMLYEDGVKVAEADVHAAATPDTIISFGKPTWYAGRFPFRGRIDDASLWNRALSPDEISSLASGRRSAISFAAKSSDLFQWRMARIELYMLESLAELRDAFMAPFDGRLTSINGDLPRIDLVMTSDDRRHFIRAHGRSIDSGRRTNDAATRRSIHASIGGKVVPASLSLDGTDTDYADSPRPSYMLEITPEADSRLSAIFGCQHLRLAPPESAGWITPLVKARMRREIGLPTATNGLCEVSINGEFQGVYIFADAARLGVEPGEWPLACDETKIHAHASITTFHQLPFPAIANAGDDRTWPWTRDEASAFFADEVLAECSQVLAHDPQSPLTVGERRRILSPGSWTPPADWKFAEETWSPARRAAEALDEFCVLGTGDLSPFRVTEPLDLDSWRIPEGVTVKWSSLDPDTIAADGSISRPDSGAPVGATLVTAISDGTETIEKQLRFRVMPKDQRLPALFVFTDGHIQKMRRVDAEVLLCEAGEDAPSRVLRATQGRSGGISFRGNTSFWYNKKLLSIKTDEPHGIFGDPVRKHILTINSFQDPSFVRNTLSNGMYRDFFGTDALPAVAPVTRHAELFINGRYHGLFELCTRVDETLIAEQLGEPASDERWIIYRAASNKTSPIDMLPRRPSDSARDREPFARLFGLVYEPAPFDYVSRIKASIEPDSFADYQLLLTFSRNINGAPFNFTAHEILVYDRQTERFFQAAWDADMTFRNKCGMIENDLFRLLMADDEAWIPLLRERWAAARAKGLCDEEIDARIDAIRDSIAGYADWEFQRWGYPEDENLDIEVERVRKSAHESLAEMDARFTDSATAN